MDYIEDHLITEYILKNYRHLLSGLEGRILHAIGHGRSDVLETEAAKKKVERVWGHAGDEEIDAALADGIDVFKKRVRDRIVNDHSKEVSLARCPKCKKLLRTPRARQCRWCKYDWHLTVIQ